MVAIGGIAEDNWRWSKRFTNVKEAVQTMQKCRTNTLKQISFCITVY